MQVLVDSTVSYAVKNVRIRSVIVQKNNKDGLVLVVPYEWLNADGVVIRSGSNRYTQEQLIQSQGQGFASVVSILSGLVPSQGVFGGFRFLFSDTGTVTAIRGYKSNVDGEWTSERLTEDQVISAISPLTVDQVKTMINQFTVSVFA